MNFNNCFYAKLTWIFICIFLGVVFSSCGGVKYSNNAKIQETYKESCIDEKVTKEECQEESYLIEKELKEKEAINQKEEIEKFDRKESITTEEHEFVKNRESTISIMEETLNLVEEQNKALILEGKIKRDFIEEHKKNLSSANIAFNTPQNMERDETTIVKLLLSHSLPLEELAKEVEETINRRYLDGQKQKVTTERIKVDTRIKIDLSGSEGFAIRKIGSIETHDKRAISKIGIEEWKWEVKAVEVGIQYLFLEIYAIIKLDGEDRYLQLKSFDREIEVYISTPSAIKSFLSAYWQWLLTIIVIPLTLAVRRWIINWIEKRNENRNRAPLIETPTGF